MNLLEVSNLRVLYGGAVLALNVATVTVPDGGSVALLGANGAGKTTLLRAVGGLLSHHRGEVRAGEIRFAGRSIVASRSPELVAAGVAQSLEGRRVFAELTVDENLRAGAFVPRARVGARKRRDEMLELFPALVKRIDGPAGLLSGGEQQMLAIARALMAAPRLLLLDEPSLGLAPLIVAEIGATLREVNARGVSILLVDQSTSLALHATDHAYLMENGRTVSDGPTRDLLSDDQVRASYLGMTAGSDRLLADGAAE